MCYNLLILKNKIQDCIFEKIIRFDLLSFFGKYILLFLPLLCRVFQYFELHVGCYIELIKRKI